MKKKYTHLVLLQHHEVEMPDTRVGVVLHTPLENHRVNYVSDILIDEGVSDVIRVSRKTMSKCRKKAHLWMSSSARSPYPFFSVSTISMSAYCLR
jgi:hypothetical protein